MNYFNGCFKGAYLKLKGDEFCSLHTSCLFPVLEGADETGAVLMLLLPSVVLVRLKNEKKMLWLCCLSSLETSLTKYLYLDFFFFFFNKHTHKL